MYILLGPVDLSIRLPGIFMIRQQQAMEAVELAGHPSVQFCRNLDAQGVNIRHAGGSRLDGIVCVHMSAVDLKNGGPDGPGLGTRVDGDPGQDGVQMAADDGIACLRADTRRVIVYNGSQALDDITDTVKQLLSSSHQSSYVIRQYTYT